ncbi:MAG: FliO/MopB family protein [Isosphaeraceae bacterium]
MGDNGGKHPGSNRFRWEILLALLLISSQGTSVLAHEPSRDLTAAPSSPEGAGTNTVSPVPREVEKTAVPVPSSLPVPRPSGHRFWPGLGSTVAPEATGFGSGPSTPGASGWWLGSAGLALVLAICGAGCVAARKHLPRESAGLLQVIGRVSLSPRQSIVLVRAGNRVLLIGTGAQGAPSLLGELPADDDNGPPGAEHAGSSPDTRLPTGKLDLRPGATP